MECREQVVEAHNRSPLLFREIINLPKTLGTILSLFHYSSINLNSTIKTMLNTIGGEVR